MASEVADHLEPWRDLKDKVVMVTGASSGLGREFCLDLAKAGCQIVAAARRVDRLNSLCDEINKPGNNVRAVAVELDICAVGATIERSVRKAWEAFGRIDALVNNAGIRGNVKSSLNLSEEEWNLVMKTNLTGAWLVSKYVCILMRDANQRGGSIINISSAGGLNNRGHLPGAVAYASSKAGLNTMTKVMALELGVHKIRVNSISPGIFRSEITKDLLQKEWLPKVTSKIVPLREYGTSDPALTSLVRYLIHDSSEYVSGNIFIVDAGTTLPEWNFAEFGQAHSTGPIYALLLNGGRGCGSGMKLMRCMHCVINIGINIGVMAEESGGGGPTLADQEKDSFVILRNLADRIDRLKSNQLKCFLKHRKHFCN